MGAEGPLNAGAPEGQALARWLFGLELTGADAAAANRVRAEKRAALVSAGGTLTCLGHKPAVGPLSPGCERCARGRFSCLFVASRCTASCFFCPQDRRAAMPFPVSGAIPFATPLEYVRYLELLGFEGVGFSGGEPLTALDRVVPFARAIREHFGPRMRMWLYTNGDLLTPRVLGELQAAGLDEIRINAAASGYKLEPIAQACAVFQDVAVEIPAIPEDRDRVLACLPAWNTLGVRFLNLHELASDEFNYSSLASRHYSFATSPEHLPTVVASTETALEVLQAVASLRAGHGSAGQPPGLSAQFCSELYKCRFHGAGQRRRAAHLAVRGDERVTSAGYLAAVPTGGNASGPDGAGEAGSYAEAWLEVADAANMGRASGFLELGGQTRLAVLRRERVPSEAGRRDLEIVLPGPPPVVSSAQFWREQRGR